MIHRLGVNVDHIATLRQARGEGWPDLVASALVCQAAGADSIVCHLREDRRHIQDADVFALKKRLSIPLNLEMSIHPSVVKTALKARPAVVTLVPERRRERTTESGLNVIGYERRIRRVIEAMRIRRINVSLFVGADERQIRMAQTVGAHAVEIHTGDYANARGAAKGRELARLKRAILFSRSLNLLTHVGHGLNYTNVKPLSRLTGLCEFNIGFSIICRAVEVGLERAVRQMKALIR